MFYQLQLIKYLFDFPKIKNQILKWENKKSNTWYTIISET